MMGFFDYGNDAAAMRQKAKKRADFIADLIRPKATKAVRMDELDRTKIVPGLFGERYIVKPSKSERKIAAVLTEIPALKKGNTLLKSLNVIQDEYLKEGQLLRARLERSSVEIPREDIKTAMDDVNKVLQENPFLVGDLEELSAKVLKNAREILDGNPNTPAGVLKSLYQFIEWIRVLMLDVSDEEIEHAILFAASEIRPAMYRIIKASVPDDREVKASLNRRAKMSDAIENLVPKVADEASSQIGRIEQRIVKWIMGG